MSFVLSEERDKKLRNYLLSIFRNRHNIALDGLKFQGQMEVEAMKYKTEGEYNFIIYDPSTKIYLYLCRTVDKKSTISYDYLVVKNDIYHKLHAKHYGTPKFDTREFLISEKTYEVINDLVDFFITQKGWREESYAPGVLECLDDFEYVLENGV